VSWEWKVVASATVVAGALLLAQLVTLVAARGSDRATRYHVRRAAHFGALLAALIAVLAVWHAFAGRAGVVIGLFAAGIAFAMQEVIGALFGWVNILSGRIYRVGDRIELAGVQGDVLDITPLRTKILASPRQRARATRSRRRRSATRCRTRRSSRPCSRG
jgi:small-conductance mechanosensitive channel